MQQVDVNDTGAAAHQDTTLLDMLVTVAENVKLLIAAPLAVGVLAYGASYLLSNSFDSVSTVRGDQQLVSLALSDEVLDAIALSTGMVPGMNPDTARTSLQSQIKVTFTTKEKPLVFRVSGSTPITARNTAAELLRQMQLKGAAKGTERDRLLRMLSDSKGRAALAERALGKINAQSEALADPSSFALKYGDLLASLASAQSEVYALDSLLQGFNQSQVIQNPSLPTSASRPDRRAIAITAALGTGLMVILFIFIRENLRRVSLQPGAAEKLMRIRRALGLATKASA